MNIIDAARTGDMAAAINAALAAPPKPKGQRPPGPANVAPPGYRLRKAWRITSRHWDAAGYEFAPTASKARYIAWLDASDTFAELPLTDIEVRRAPERDVLLPEPHPIVADLTERERHCLLHAFGGTGRSAGYRDYFYTHEGDLPLVRLVEMGLMEMVPMTTPRGAAMAYFVLNWMGKRVAMSMQPTYPA